VEEKIAVTDCKLYQHYANVLQLGDALGLFVADFVTAEFCDKAAFHFGYLCNQCKKHKQKGGD
jgi:hypothetical protein